MLFNEPRFFLFFLIVFGVHWLLSSDLWRKAWLLATSYVFYGAWDWRFLSLIAASTLLDYVVALGLERSALHRRRWIAASLIGQLGLLGFFKYFGFFVDSAVDFLELLGFQAHRPTLAIVLPAGISFYTFQTLSYTLDVYFGKLRATRSLLDFSLFVAFFPQLVAGPILRCADFLPQLARPRRFAAVDVRAALMLFLVGFVKKAAVSDNLAPVIERYFAAPQEFDTLSAWIAVLAYATQIYCDFSGYSDMAVGCAALLGYRLCQNFAQPYLAADLVEFWRRWHMSLSTWLRDYLYVPLGGNRGGRLATYRNLMLTMLLGGLWHGAGWNFVLWGGLHGLGLCFLRLRREHGGSFRVPRWLGVPLTFYFVCCCWILFRAQDLSAAGTIARGFVLCAASGTSALDWRILVVLGLLGGAHVIAGGRRLANWWRRGPDWAFAGTYALLWSMALPFVSVDFVPFIYFQF